jgi:DNA-binding transcriptional ArsR family regulator
MAPALADDQLSLTFGALADPTRREILAQLSEGDAGVVDIAALFPKISLQAVSKHLRVLERAGLVTRSRAARHRPAHLRTDAMIEAVQWLAHHRVHYEESLDRLGEHLARVQADQSDPEES